MLRTVLKAMSLAVLLSVSLTSHGAAKTTDEVWNHHLDAWNKQSVNDIVKDYDEKSILILNSQIFKGEEAIGHVFSQLFNIFNKGTSRIDAPVIKDRFVYLIWYLTPKGQSEFFGTDTFVVEEGKITLQTITSAIFNTYPVEPIKK
jgi:hypothetical protein